MLSWPRAPPVLREGLVVAAESPPQHWHPCPAPSWPLARTFPVAHWECSASPPQHLQGLGAQCCSSSLPPYKSTSYSGKALVLLKKKKKRVHCSIGNENKITDTVCSPLSLNRHERASLCSPFTLGFPAHGPVSFCAPLTRGSLGRLQPPHSGRGLQLPASGRQIWHSSKTISGMKTNYFTKSSLEAWWNGKAGKKLFFGKKVHLKRLLSYTFFFKPCRRNTCLEAFKLCTLIAFSKRGEYGAESCF